MSRIQAATPEQWIVSLGLAHADLPEAERGQSVMRFLQLIAQGEIDPEGILVAWSHDALRGVQLAFPLPGKSGLLWPPRVVAAGDTALEDELVQAALRFLRQRGCRVAQAILQDDSCFAALERSGIRFMTRLEYMSHDLASLCSAAETTWQLQPFEADEELFRKTLLQTYEHTLDCPELNQVRSVGEILEGHRAQGDYRQGQWQLALVEGKPAGLVLLSALRGSDSWDLSYLGIVPGRRGQGWGRALTAWALRRARAAHASDLQVAVDVRNQPALGLYRKLGFVKTAQRVVLMHVFPSNLDDSAARSGQDRNPNCRSW